jgi:hypothetical protein
MTRCGPNSGVGQRPGSVRQHLVLRRLCAVEPPQPPAPDPGQPASGPPKVAPRDAGLSGHERRNRAAWNADADDYQARHGQQLAGDGKAWGTWNLPESELHVLGDVAGRDILELGCGAAQG